MPVSLAETVKALNDHVAPYFRKISGNRFRITFKRGYELTTNNPGRHYGAIVEVMKKAAPCYVGQGGAPYCGTHGRPGGLNRLVFLDPLEIRTAFATQAFGIMPLKYVWFSDMQSIVHEIGHGWMGWPHSFIQLPWQVPGVKRPPGPNQYSNTLDFMSGYQRERGWDQDMPTTMAINRYSAGWIDPSEVALHLTDSATYTLSKPLDDAHAGKQFLVVHSGRTGAFTTLEVLPERLWYYRTGTPVVRDRAAPDKVRHFRTDGVLVSRYDQTTGTGTSARFGPALYNINNPKAYKDVNEGWDDYAVIIDGESRNIGSGVMVAVSKNEDGSYQVTVSGGKIAEFQPWCIPIGDNDEFDTPCIWDTSKPIAPDNFSDVVVLTPSITSDPNDDGVAGDDDTYALGDVITISVPLSAPIRPLDPRQGNPQLKLQVGGRTRTAGFSEVSGNALIFSYTVQKGDHDADGISIGKNSVKLSRFIVIRGLNGKKINSEHPALPNQAGHKIDGVVPGITAGPNITSNPDVSGPDDDTYAAGDVITVAVKFNRRVTVETSGGVPQLALVFGWTVRQAAYSGGSGSKTLTFSYTVTDADGAPSGILIPANALTANGATIKWRDGINDADLRHQLVVFATHKASATLPNVAPSQPGAITLTPGNHEAILTWPTAVDGNVAGYEYQVSANGGAWPTAWVAVPLKDTIFTNASDGAALNYTVPNLRNGDTYQFRLRAVNARGSSGPHRETASITLLPHAPTGLVATAGGGQATLTWNAPDSAHGVGGYQYRVGVGEPVEWSEWRGPVPPGDSYVVTDLKGGRHAFQLRAVIPGDGGMPSRQSVPSETVYANLKPGKLSLCERPYNNYRTIELRVRKDDPTVNKYTVMMRDDDDAEFWTLGNPSIEDFGNCMRIQVHFLDRNKWYHFKVQAHNEYGAGAVMDPVTMHTFR